MFEPVNCCRLCGATSYRRVIERDASGAPAATGLFRCSGCSVVFADPIAWREGSLPVAEASSDAREAITPLTSTRQDQSTPAPSPPDFSGYMPGLRGPGRP